MKNILLAAALPLMLVSCDSGVKKAPPRKSMPGAYIPGAETEESSGTVKKEWDNTLPFETRVVDLSATAISTTYYSVALPDNFYDSIAFSLADRYRPIAMNLLEGWLQADQKGIILDLRTTNGSNKSANYSIRLDKKQVPLQLLWDDASEKRSEKYINLIKTVPEIQAVTQ
ncbi:hypothetical protein [Chitinophaga sp. sic0106]|uniref:hypothetical protein n=1 Tax=Chitinophaga sp. sic0106 TaxID=2854785 RepID=UPI001C45A4DB|nr:hypothetical protein [Chitinophaga sp. sic0106]MBV7531199.1 hypothetical protein [Chitinophaga sp. sic0106]